MDDICRVVWYVNGCFEMNNDIATDCRVGYRSHSLSELMCLGVPYADYVDISTSGAECMPP